MGHVFGRLTVTVLVGLGLASAGGALAAEPFPAWAYPASNLSPPAKGWDHVAPVHIAASQKTVTEAELHDLHNAVDWRPQDHPPAPSIVMRGWGTDVAACGFCHLPNGQGRPENASLAGLPAPYIVAQVSAFHNGTRHAALADWTPTALMANMAGSAPAPAVAAAAAYFASLPYVSRTRVHETQTVRQPVARGFLFMLSDGPHEPLGQRIVETPASFERFERRDPTVSFVAYVPVGSLGRGRALAETGDAGRTQPCATCHGAGLRGGAGAIGPPLAGRSPTYLFRQLYNFQSGARAGDASAPMQGVVSKLSQPDMIALAAYAGSLRP